MEDEEICMAMLSVTCLWGHTSKDVKLAVGYMKMERNREFVSFLT